MTYLTYGFCAVTVLWIVYLLFRSMKLRIPERLGVCCTASVPKLVLGAVEFIGLMAIVFYAASKGVWALAMPSLLLCVGFVAVMSVWVRNSMAFTADGFVICGLFGAPKRYVWADVSACIATKTVVPRSNALCNQYTLKLPQRDVVLHDSSDGVCAFINQLRRHKPMLNIPAPGRKNK